ncbi:MAG: acetyl-CoA carboxylase biotin carboxyl carrier protein [Caulobacteraceae bacterium]
MPNPKAPAASIDSRLVRELAAVLNETGLSEIEVERDGLKIRVARSPGPPVPNSAPAPAMAPSAAPVALASSHLSTSSGGAAGAPAHAGDVVKSPMVGTVYLQAQPGSPPFAQVGDTVAEGQTLLLVEAMKTMNPIVSPRAGKVLEVLVGDAQPVEYGEPLVVLG